MAEFGKRSRQILEHVHPDIVRVLTEAIKTFDFTVTAGRRTYEEQKALYDKGRTTAGPIVTWCDGLNDRSRHQSDPGEAVDLAPWPIDWNDDARFIKLGEHVLDCAERLGVRLEWGGHWRGRKRDLPHFELRV